LLHVRKVLVWDSRNLFDKALYAFNRYAISGVACVLKTATTIKTTIAIHHIFFHLNFKDEISCAVTAGYLLVKTCISQKTIRT